MGMQYRHKMDEMSDRDKQRKLILLAISKKPIAKLQTVSQVKNF